MNPSEYCFTLNARDFEDEKSLKKSFLFDENGNPNGNKDSLQVATIRPGLHVIISRRNNPTVIPRYNFDVKDMPVGFAFHLSGKLETTLNRGQGKQPVSILNQRGSNTVICLNGAKGHSQYLSDNMQDALIICVAPRIFTDLIAEELDGIPKDCRRLLRQKNLFFSLPMTREMYIVATRAFHHQYQGAASHLHLEACGLELLALQMNRFSQQDACREKPLCRADEERIRMAGDILVQKMDAPPTISALALQVGVNSAKLKRGFKQVFGTTIGQFLLQHRMACARELILNRETDVTQAAFSVGYSNVSHFIRYYKKTFGVTPGSHKQTRDSHIVLPSGK